VNHRPGTLFGVRIRAALGVLGALCATALLLVPAADAGAQTKPAASNKVVTAAIAAALSKHAIPADPNKLTPDYLSIIQNDPNSLQGTSWLKGNCNPYSNPSQAAAPQPCFYGSTSASRTIVIFGDSYVGNWIPALDAVGKSLGYRIAAFEFAGCITPFVAPTSSSPASYQACTQFHSALPAAVQALHPLAVLAANGTPAWGSGDSSWVQGMVTAFNEVTANSPTTARILLGTGPHLPHPAPACLAAYPQSLQKCTLTYNPAGVGANQYAAALARDQQGATAAHATLVPTSQWFCLKNQCPVLINNMLVYADADHVSIVYSKYLAKVLQQALAPVIPAS